MNIDVIIGCINGDERSRRSFYNTYANKIFGICRRYIWNSTDAEDVFQEAFINIFNSLDKFDSQKGNLEAWISRVAINSALMWLRKNAKLKNEDSRDSNEYEVIEKEDSADVIQDLSAEQALLIVDALPTRQRTVFNLYAIEGYTHKEIGEIMEISEGTSKSQLSKARACLAKNELIKELISG
jgi:RNA polymerase sigma-70 factor (ECF subfamily)